MSKARPRTPPPPPRLLLPAALLFAAALLVYLPVLRCGYVWDDDRFLTENPLIHAADGLYRFWFTREAPDYFPLTSTTLWIEWRLWGGPTPADPARGAWGFHLVNMLLHAGSGVLIWRILRRLAVPGAWLAALFFLIHPVNVESVAWITERKNALSMCLYTGALLSWLRFEDNARRRDYIASLLLFLAALLSKTSVVMLPVVLLGCAWWRRGRIDRTDILRTVPFFACSLALGLLTVFFQYTVNIQTDVVRGDGLLSRTAIAGRAVWFYLGKALVPVDLAFAYERWPIGRVSPVIFLPGIALLAVFAVLWMKRATWGRPALAGLGYFVISLLPVLGFLDIYFMRYALVANHWQYVAIPGIIALVVGAATHWAARNGESARRAATAVAVIVAILFAGQTIRSQAKYKDEETLWRQTLKDSPRAFIAHNNLGVILERRGEHQKAIELFEAALSIQPDYKDAWANMGNALSSLGRHEEARRAYESCLALDERYVRAHINLGNTLTALGEPALAVTHFERAAELAPDRADIHFNLAATLNQMGEPAKAVAAAERALALEPENLESLNNLAAALAQQGRYDQALELCEQALKIQPDNAIVLFNAAYMQQLRGEPGRATALYRMALEKDPMLGNARLGLAESLETLGNTAEAADEYRRVLQLMPGELAALRALGWILASSPEAALRDGREALRLAGRLVELSPGEDPAAPDLLAAAEAEAGDFGKAAETASRAAALARQKGQSELAAAIEARRRLYQEGRPYRGR